MLEKDKFLEKTNFILFLTVAIFFISPAKSNDVESILLEYNSNLNNTSLNFIQTDSSTVEEGVLYIGSDRIRVEYIKPKKITIIISDKKGMYVNHSLKETQFFNTKDTSVDFFFNIFMESSFFKDIKIISTKKNIYIKKSLEVDNIVSLIEIIYEDNPIKIRKVKVKNKNISYEFGFFSIKKTDNFDKKFFSLIDPYLLN